MKKSGSSGPSTLSELLAAIAVELDRAAVPYMVIGGQAVLVYGRPRVTEDIDVTLGLAPDQFDRLTPVVQRLGLELIDVGMPVREFVRSTLLFPCRHAASGMRVDFAFSMFEYEAQAIARARSMPVAGRAVRFAAVEDLVVMKVIAGRPQDLDDVKAVYVKNQTTLDEGYVRQWLTTYSEMLAEPFLQRFDAIVKSVRR